MTSQQTTLQLTALLLVLAGLGLAVFMVNRLYILLARRTITVKGITYSREKRPVLYWLIAVMATFGLLAGLTIALFAWGVVVWSGPN